MVPGDLDRGIEPGDRRIELPQLQLDAFADRARADAGRIERLNDVREGGFDLGGLALDLGPQGVGDLLQRLRQVAVVADGIDDGARDGQLARRELRQLELPQKMFLQRLAGGVGEFLLPVIVIAAPGGVGRSDAALAPALIQHLDGALARSFRGGFGRFRRRRVLQRRGVEAFLMAIVHRLQHDVGLEEFADMRLQLEGGQLQEPDGLLQLRGHRQLLTQPELQRGFQHAGTEAA